MNMKHKTGNIYRAAGLDRPIVLVRSGTGHVLGTSMGGEMNRSFTNEGVPVEKYYDITAEEMDQLFDGRVREFLGTFPDFKFDDDGEITCTK